jgi:hypothetical protein
VGAYGGRTSFTRMNVDSIILESQIEEVLEVQAGEIDTAAS